MRVFTVGFFVGLLVGGVAARLVGPRFGHPHMSPEKRQEHILRRLTSELELDKSQQQSINQLLQEGRKNMDEVMSPVRSHFDDVRKEVNSKIRALLNPEQQKKFDALNEKMEKRWRERGGNSPGPDHP